MGTKEREHILVTIEGRNGKPFNIMFVADKDGAFSAEQILTHYISNTTGAIKSQHEIVEGTQILYMPTHANGNPKHKDVQEGFVTSIVPSNNCLFCRYWSKFSPGELRTRANSELTNIRNIMVEDTHSKSDVNAMLKRIEDEEDKEYG